ncbi:MAG: hypothetical protein NWE95_12040 [Candidatus Bathyarchaeota archaeon]|nr:hypothetical protein [Candidatus Bathyarchaeota archaeon]
MNSKGQFSIIAALLVALVLVGAVVSTYSAIRYSVVQEQPQILSVSDETNLAVKEMLGFTVGYYGSVLKVTGNQTYAQELATDYLKSGLINMDAVNPEWGLTINVTDLALAANWFTNRSYSQGNATVTYDLKGLGMTGVSYSASIRLDVQILEEESNDKARLTILTDDGKPLINLGKSNFNFYRYDNETSTWGLVQPDRVLSYADGTYLIDLPDGVRGSSYDVEIKDNRGLMVIASSYNKITSTVTWNATGFSQEHNYVDSASDGIGTHSDFTAQQADPNNIYDRLTEAYTGTVTVDNYPSGWNPLGSTTNVSGSLADLQSDNGVYMQLRSHPAAYNTINFDSQNSEVSTSGNSISWTHTTSAGSDRILLVAIDIFRASGGSPTTITSITYGGTALTPLATAVYDSNPRVRSYVYYLLNPASGTRTISVNFASSTYAVGGSITYTNVDQTTPFLTSNTNTGSGTSQSVTVTAVGEHTKVLFGHLASYRTSSPSAYTVTDGQPPTRWSETDQLYKGFGSDKTVTSGLVSTTWSTSREASWVAIAVLLQPTALAGASYICDAEFTGSSNTETWNNLVWTIDAAATTSDASATYQLYNYRTGQYVTVGDGYLTDTLGTEDTTKTQTITSSLTDFRDASGNWKLKVSTNATTQFDLKLDLMKYSINQDNYQLNLEEHWVNINATNLRQDLCIKTGAMGSEPLIVQVWGGGSWHNLMTLIPNHFNNVSLVPYIESSSLTIRFVGGNDEADSTSDNWDIDSVFIKDQPDVNFLINLQESTFTLEVLQNGTMRWLGQNMESTTETVPIPPVPVKAIHVNQTFVNGTNKEVPFQVEDWASQYQIPLGLTSNTTVFSNRQMIVFLLDYTVTSFTIWWDGSDSAVQTPLAYTNNYFTYNENSKTLNNGRLSLVFSSTGFVLNSTVGSVTSTSTLMRINTKLDTTDPELSFPIAYGIVRDIVLGEAEYSGGITNCPNTYTNIVITLPARVTYYTYQLRVMFLSASSRTISDLCPVKLTTNLSPVQTQTENGTLADFPIVQNGTGLFSDYASGGHTAHHWSQFITDTGQGTGIMFTNKYREKLYAFDTIAGSPTGALNVNSGSRLIELLPVSSLKPASFTYAYDITWHGAVATFDGTTPICSMYDGTTPTGLWLLVEYPPTLTVTAAK